MVEIYTDKWTLVVNGNISEPHGSEQAARDAIPGITAALSKPITSVYIVSPDGALAATLVGSPPINLAIP